MRCPSSPGHGGASSPGSSFWNFWQNTIRPLVLPDGGCVGPAHPLMGASLTGCPRAADTLARERPIRWDDVEGTTSCVTLGCSESFQYGTGLRRVREAGRFFV